MELNEKLKEVLLNSKKGKKHVQIFEVLEAANKQRVKLSQQQIADMLDLRHNYVFKAIQYYRRRGIIQRDDDNIYTVPADWKEQILSYL